ncbi:MAG: hypothetical protein ACKOPT_14955 [Cyanobium sp.]
MQADQRWNLAFFEMAVHRVSDLAVKLLEAVAQAVDITGGD